MSKFKKSIFVVLLFLFFALSQGFTRCFYPGFFMPIVQTIELPCVFIHPDACYFVTLGLDVSEGDKVGMYLVSVNATNATPSELQGGELLPYYDQDNNTLIIPALVYFGKAYSVYLKPIVVDGDIRFSILNVVPFPSPTEPICFPDGMDSEFHLNVYSYKVMQRGELTLCYEFEGSREFISIASSVPPLVPFGDIEVVGGYEPCPLGYLVGCYMLDEDKNWYAMYKYRELDSVLGAMVLFCPEEDGYNLFIP